MQHLSNGAAVSGFLSLIRVIFPVYQRRKFSAARIIVEGHTDGSRRGQIPPSVVKELSLNRANAVREALILGKPVVGTKVGGIPELIQHGVTGLLVEPNNITELVKMLKSLIDDPNRRAEMSKEALAFADDKLNVEKCKIPFYNLLLEVSRGANARN